MDDVKQEATALVTKKGPHRWKKGQTGNPNGRPKAPDMQLLREAITKCEAKYKKPIYEMFVEMAYRHKDVMVALMKKLVADQSHSHVEGEGFGDRYTFIQGGQQIDTRTMSRLVDLLRERSSQAGSAKSS